MNAIFFFASLSAFGRMDTNFLKPYLYIKSSLLNSSLYEVRLISNSKFQIPNSFLYLCILYIIRYLNINGFSRRLKGGIRGKAAFYRC
jgi:hypothetical protein